MTNIKYKLFNWKIDSDLGKRKVYDWSGDQLNDDELNKLCIGDCIRLILIDLEPNNGWEKIYFEITKINYYKKGGTNIPRTYYGKALKTYRLESEEQLRYVHTGDIISFQKNNIIEIPYWSKENQLKQHNSEIIDNFIKIERL
jgi:hypothetical protein